ncbi:TetR/AcrR family transcriptional regulator [Streptomyces sp. NPDC001435]|uniref:TetR/AcrR family transcriptional regulator n=1 Tax=Streptomyces sp. NPDC001435 TaxID=3364576 RepID=UPI0036822A3B
MKKPQNWCFFLRVVPMAASRRNRFERRRSETRRPLVRAARKILTESGDTSTSIRAIAERSDMGPGSLYNDVSCKAELFDAALADALDEYAQAVDECRHDLGGPAECLARGLRLSARTAGAHPEITRILQRTRPPMRRPPDVGGCDQSVGPGPEERLVLARHAEQAADHHDGQRIGEVVDDVDLPARLERLQQFPGDPVDLAAHGIDPAGAVWGPQGRMARVRSLWRSGSSSRRNGGLRVTSPRVRGRHSSAGRGAERQSRGSRRSGNCRLPGAPRDRRRGALRTAGRGRGGWRIR